MTDLPRRLQAGEPEAFQEFHRRYSGRLHRFIARLVGEQDAEDLVQDVMVRVLKAIRSYREADRFDAWVYRIANNLCLDTYRRHRPRASLPALAASDRFDPQWSIDRRERLEALLAEIRQLPFEQKQVFLLREEAGLSFKEISRMLDAPLGTVLARMKYAMDRLRARLFRPEVAHAL